MRYLLHQSQLNELNGRQAYLYDIFQLYFLPGKPEGSYIPLVPLGTKGPDVLFITGHTHWFSVFWGLGAVIVTIFFHKMKESRDFILIILGTFVCGIYQYLFHMMEEHLFEMRFDTTSQFDVLNGRVDMLFCIIGGVLVMFWVKDIYPVFSNILGKVPAAMRNIVSIILVLLMAANLGLSGMALHRMGERYRNLPEQSALDVFLDLQYPNEFLEARLPNIRSVEVPTWMEELPVDWNRIKEKARDTILN